MKHLILLLTCSLCCLAQGAHYVPADKNLSPEWLEALESCGERKIYRGDELFTIGMPCGGIAAGQLYVRGDGTLARWWMFNENISTHFRHKTPDTGYATYRPPSRIDQGMAISAQLPEQEPVVMDLSKKDFNNIGFIGEYPIATILYEGPNNKAFPLEVQSEVFSPTIPLNTKESATPGTLLRYTVKNPTHKTIDVKLGGWLQHAPFPGADHNLYAMRRTRRIKNNTLNGIFFDMARPTDDKDPAGRRIIVFEDFEDPIQNEDGTSDRKGSYDNWTVEGTGFGQHAMNKKELPRVTVGFHGQHTAFCGAGPKGWELTGKLTSKPFIIKEAYIGFRTSNDIVPYGSDPQGDACLNLVIDGEVVRSATGSGEYAFKMRSWNVADLVGKEAHFEVIDSHPGKRFGVDHLIFSNRQPIDGAIYPENDPQFGNIYFGLLNDDSATATLDLAEKDNIFEKADTIGEQVFPSEATPNAATATAFTLKPGEEKNVTFVLTWYFPNLIDRRPGCPGNVGRMYSNWYKDAKEVATFLAKNYDRLYAATAEYRDTLYLDSTLPYWFLQRSAASSSTLASETCFWWKNGRFYASEGVWFCHGTCGHVWNYSQSPSRLFPELERSVRTDQDFNLDVSQKPTGRINFRGFNDNTESFKKWGYIPDAQAGYILKAYREHLMSADDQFLTDLWPRIKNGVEYLMERDARHGPLNGILEDLQHLTDSLGWGPNTFSGSLYLAALRAAEQMALLQDDPEFAATCRKLYTEGEAWTLANLWNGQYFFHKYEPAPKGGLPGDHTGRAYSNGCLSDQVFGQNWAHQLNLGYIYPKSYVDQALDSVFKYNWTPDIGTVYAVMTRRFILLANEGEPGMVGLTYPLGDPPKNRIAQNDDPWTGYEYQAASGMIWEDMLTEGLSIAYGVHQRYNGTKHNPWNEIEGGDHYSRAMSAWGLLLSASGYIYDGPAGIIGFAPHMNPKNFKSFFSAAEGWGSISQKRKRKKQINTLTVRWGNVRISSFVTELSTDKKLKSHRLLLDGKALQAEAKQEGNRITFTLEHEIELKTGATLKIASKW